VEILPLTQRVESVAHGDGRWEIPVAQPASTVVIARPAKLGFEVLLLQRSSTMAFAPHMAVFPGGRVDSSDYEQADPFIACAYREVHEEVGLNLGDLVHLDHWITPEVEPIRYDVHFYLAIVDGDVEGELVTTEAHTMLWLTPADAYSRSLDGSLPMLRPTQVALTELNQNSNVEQLHRFASDRIVIPRLPKPVVDLNGEIRWDLVHGVTGELISFDVGRAKQETTGSDE
jgi:8-oxo-dGTP pyrophosphatase MutT (NUDIX family)